MTRIPERVAEISIIILWFSCLECCEYGEVYSLIPICSITLHHQLSVFTILTVLESESTITHFN